MYCHVLPGTAMYCDVQPKYVLVCTCTYFCQFFCTSTCRYVPPYTAPYAPSACTSTYQYVQPCYNLLTGTKLLYVPAHTAINQVYRIPDVVCRQLHICHWSGSTSMRPCHHDGMLVLNLDHEAWTVRLSALPVSVDPQFAQPSNLAEEIVNSYIAFAKKGSFAHTIWRKDIASQRQSWQSCLIVCQ